MLDLSKNIIYEDEDILAINKPVGLIVHPAPQQAGDGASTDGQSVTEWFVGKYPEVRGVGEQEAEVERSGIVHRLDRDTSGALLLAKTAEGHKVLKKQFMDRKVEKIYHLFVHGLVKNDFGTINLPIGKSPSDFRKWIALTQRMFTKKKYKSQERPLDSARGKEALTYYKVLARDASQGVTLVEAKPKTGRTHQIRVHFKSIHHPILRDRLYGPKIVPRSLGEVGRTFNRLALHARSITFKNTAGEQITVEAPYPEDFQETMDIIGFGVLD